MLYNEKICDETNSASVIVIPATAGLEKTLDRGTGGPSKLGLSAPIPMIVQSDRSEVRVEV